jgi:hypothetical protein
MMNKKTITILQVKVSIMRVTSRKVFWTWEILATVRIDLSHSSLGIQFYSAYFKLMISTKTWEII